MVHTAISALREFLSRTAASEQATAGFRDIPHKRLLNTLRDRIDRHLGRHARATIIHSLQEAGCDILVEFVAQGIKHGIQVKSYDDIKAPGFARDTLSQIEDSHQHGLKRLYLVLAADLTNRSQAQKARNLLSRISQMNDEYVVPIEPERAWTLIFGQEPEPMTETSLVPVPPQPYFAHPYPLQASFTGRVREREMLSQWLTKDDRPVFALVAIGGMGKSALTWAWVNRDVLGLPLVGQADDEAHVAARCRVPEADRPEGVLWWSFYESEASFDSFVRTAVAYASGGDVDPASIPSLYDGCQALLTLLQRKRILLVLDGLERILNAYTRLDAPYQGDDVTEDPEQKFRACTDPHAARFLKSLCSVSQQSRVLITSRLFPRELDDLAGCAHKPLKEFGLEDAIAFFSARGVKGTRAEIATELGRYGCHPLALRLLSGMIASDPARPGDIAIAREHDPTQEDKLSRILQFAYEALTRDKQQFLSRLAAFCSAMDYDAVKAVSNLADDRATKQALRELVARGLLHGSDDAHPRCDLHPIVRQHAYDRLADKEGVHSRLRDYFDAVPKPDQAAVKSLDDLHPVIELYHHTVRAGRYDGALALFRDRLTATLYFQFGAYLRCIELLSALFPEGQPFTAGGKAAVPRLKDEWDQAWTLNELANSYSLSGQPRRAVLLLERNNAFDEERGDRGNLAIGLGNLAYQEIGIGDLAAGEDHLRRRIALCREIKRNLAVGLGNLAHQEIGIGDLTAGEDHLRRRIALCREIGEWQEAVGHQELGRLLGYGGDFGDAATELGMSTAYWAKTKDAQGLCLDEAYRALRALLMGAAGEAVAAAQRARELAEQHARTDYPFESDFVKAEWLLGWAKVALAGEDERRRGQLLAEAEAHLTEAVTRCRRINCVLFEPDILLAWARWHREKGNRDEARKHAQEALAIADRCEYRLKQADIHNFLARLALDDGDKATARKEATIGRECAECDGEPHWYKPAVDEAERLLKDV